MKHTLLATTALLAMTGAAVAEITISGTGRLGLLSTEGTKAKDATLGTFQAVTTAGVSVVTTTNGGTALTNFVTANATQTVASLGALNTFIGVKEALLATTVVLADRKVLQTQIASMKAVVADSHKAGKEAVAAVKDATSAQNRMRFSFKGTGETDSGISFGVSGRFEQSNSSTAGSQFVSGAFGKISMGDLDGADESAAGGGVSGVGLTGLSDTNDFAYASSSHNLGYEYSASGITFGYSTNTAVTTGSNSAFGLKYTGDMGGATVTIGLGQAKIGTATQGSMSASVSTGGLTIKAITSTNDNGPDRKVVAEKAMVTTAGSEVVYAGDVTAKAAPDTDQTGVSISYAMDAMSVTAFSKTVSTSGAKDMDYSGFGFTYDLGGVTLKAGVVDNNDQQLMDFGVSFSF
jgi:outer membrane protein OmpU